MNTRTAHTAHAVLNAQIFRLHRERDVERREKHTAERGENKEQK